MSEETINISLNADVGEGYGSWVIGEDLKLLDLVTEANIACGFHAGDPDILRRTCQVCVDNGVNIGAQVSFYDIRGFGRRFIELPMSSLMNDVTYQLGALAGIAKVCGGEVQYVKAHGSLDHAAIKYPEYAAALVGAVKEFDDSLAIMCQPGTGFAQAVVESGLRLIPEGYIDRAYRDGGLLVPRGVAGAVITDPEVAGSRAVQIAKNHQVTMANGKSIDLDVESLCIHSDSPGAVDITVSIRTALESAGIRVRRIDF